MKKKPRFTGSICRVKLGNRLRSFNLETEQGTKHQSHSIRNLILDCTTKASKPYIVETACTVIAESELEEFEQAMASPVLQAEVRLLGKTEANWCAAVESGTGITITSILFDHRVPVADLKQSLTSLLSLHPRLRSVIFFEENEFVFRTPEEPHVRLSETETDEESWHSITEKELNTSFAKEYPIAVFQPKLYRLKSGSSLLLLRVHAAAADMASTGTILRHVVSFLGKKEEPRVSQAVDLVSLEDGIPPGQADKPFWAHGLDVVGYGLSSRRHAHLPFEDTKSDRVSKLIRAALTADTTTSLLKVLLLLNLLILLI